MAKDNITTTPDWKRVKKLLVPSFFDAKTFDSWMLCENPLLGMVAPIDMIIIGRTEKLIKFIKQALSENKPK